MDRVFGFDQKGWGFESLEGYQFIRSAEMKLTRHQRIELIRLRRLKRREAAKRRSLAQLGEHPVLTRDDGGSKPSRLTNDVPIAQ